MMLCHMDRCLRPPFKSQLRRQRRYVILDRLLRQEHPFAADLPVGQPFPDELQNPALLPGQRR